MLGTLRFLLAALVALSHIGWLPLGLNPGNAAVVVFYLISGYVVAGLWQRLKEEANPLRLFYIDRFLRIYPTYFIVLVLGVLVYVLVKPETYYLSDTPGLKQLIENITIVPLNYYMFNGSDRFVFIPSAWSLGTEVQFYLLLPLLLRFPRSVFALSLSVGVIAQLGFIPRDWFTYRLPPGIFHIFMAGALLATASTSRERYLRAGVIWVIYATLLVLLYIDGPLLAHREPELYVIGMWSRNPEMLIGLLLGIPALVWLAPMKPHIWDQRLGDISYGLFLNHFIVLWCMTAWIGSVNWFAFLAISSLVSFCSWYSVDRPSHKLRYSLRKRITAA